MTYTQEYLLKLVKELRALPDETEWIEFKHNYVNHQEIGEYISALSNSAALSGKVMGYLVWGIEDKTHNIIGTDFRPKSLKVGNEELENWLLRLLTPKINFRFYELQTVQGKVVILEIDRAFRHPVQFQGKEYIRIGTYKKLLKEFPEKERQLWRIFDTTPFEELNAGEKLNADDIIHLLDYPSYFELTAQPLPDSKSGIISRLLEDSMITKDTASMYSITNLGAILYAKNLDKFKNLKRKSVRVIVYKDTTRLNTIKEQIGNKGYAAGFKGLTEFINTLIPSNEVISKTFRKNIPMYPEIAVRELVANAIIHQDLFIHGTSPMIEIFSDRMEITNPGKPLVNTERFLDSPPKSRNEVLASFMRRIGVCEERGSGVDKVVFQTELYQLPAPLFEVIEDNTRVTLFAHRPLKKMDRNERIRATYLHACLKYVQKQYLTNSTLRERFGITKENSAMVSRIIKEASKGEMIKLLDPDNESRKYAKYVPFWA
ncbi:MAG: ATP-binding protein [bacterium]